MTRKEISVLILIIIAGALLRFDFLYSSSFQIDSDEAIVGLMAKHKAEGSHLPAFYYGQHYMGSLEPWLVSIVYKLIGVGNLGLKLVPYFFSVLLIYLSFLIAKELSCPRAGIIAALLTAFAPAALIVWSLKARGGFIELVVIGALSLLLTIRYLQNKSSLRYSCASVFLLLGLGWWVNFQIVYFIIPICFFIFCAAIHKEKIKELLLALPLCLISFLIGSLPFWIYNVENNFISTEIFFRPKTTSTIDNLFGFFETALPVIMGAKRFWHIRDFLPGATLIYYSAFVLCILFYLFFRRKFIFNLFKLKADINSAPELLAFFLICTFVIFIKSSFGYLVHAPRYLLPVYAAIFPLTAFVIVRYFPRRLALSVLSIILVLNILSCYYKGRALEGEPYVFQQQRVSKDHSQLINWLNRRKISFVRTNYWIGYRLALETLERTKFVVFGEPREARIPQYEIDGRKMGLDTMPVITVTEQGRLVRKALKSLGYSFKERTLSLYKVFFDIKPPAIEKELGLLKPVSAESNYNQENVAAAIDNNSATRWGSAHPQIPGMTFSIKYPADSILTAIEYQLSGWKPDYPRSLQIDLVDPQGQIHNLLTKDQFYAIRYFWDADFNLKLYFQPMPASAIVFTQAGIHPVFDWSIAEIKSYTPK